MCFWYGNAAARTFGRARRRRPYDFVWILHADVAPTISNIIFYVLPYSLRIKKYRSIRVSACVIVILLHIEIIGMINRHFPQRHRMRWQNYDYTLGGAYFITICTHRHHHCFGEIVDGEMIRNAAGEMLAYWYAELEHKFNNIECGVSVVMPNHFHCLLLKMDNGASVADIVRWFKTMTTNAYIKRVKQHNSEPFDERLWQRSYWDRVVRNVQEYEMIQNYIFDNPRRWHEDKFYMR